MLFEPYVRFQSFICLVKFKRNSEIYALYHILLLRIITCYKNMIIECGSQKRGVFFK